MQSDKLQAGDTIRELSREKVILEGIVKGTPLAETLENLARMIEGGQQGVFCTVSVLDATQPAVTGVFGARLGPGMQKALLGSAFLRSPCGMAVDGKKTVALEDIAGDKRWQGTEWQKAALREGFRTCRSTPIFGSRKEVLGTVDLYSSVAVSGQAAAPTETDIHLASIAIERFRSETALRENEQRLRLAVEGADLGVWDWNLVTDELIFSERCRQLFGIPSGEELTYARFAAALHPDDRERTRQAVEEALANMTAYKIEYRAVWPDGSVHWLAAIGRGFDEGGKGSPTFMRGIVFDVTDRKQAEIDVEESADRFRFLAESLPEKIFTATPEGETDYLNEQWAVYAGLPVEEVMARGWREFVHPDDLEEKMRRWEHATRHGKPFEFEHRFRRADGAYRWHLSRARPMRRKDGRIIMWVGSNIDVDDLKRAQFDLRESESRSRLAMEAAGLGFWDWNIGKSVRWSPEHNRIVGLDPDILEGSFELFMECVHPADRSRVAAALEIAQAQRLDYEAEFRVSGREGDVRWIGAHGRAYYDDQTGRPVRMIGLVRDVTERKKFEEQLRRNQEELRAALTAAELTREQAEAASRAKDQFLAVLSHELRTPLTPVLMAVSAIGLDRTLSPHVRDALEMIQRNIKIEARLIEDLLDLTRINRNRMELVIEPMDLHLAVRRALEVCTADLEAKKHHLSLDLAAGNSRVEGDPARLQQVFWNLIKNAVKFTPEGGRISLRSSNEPGRIFVEISDSGIGISAEALPKIFDPFEQGDRNFARQFGGLGLGLAISKATVEAHKGVLRVSSGGNDRGATFIVELATQAP